MTIKEKLINRYLKPRFSFVWLQMAVISALTAGMAIGLFFLVNDVVIPRIRATSTPWVQTDWSGGDSSTLVSETVNTWTSLDGVEATASAGLIVLDQTDGWSSDYHNWAYRRKITFDNTDATLGVTSENLTDFPVLVKLDTGTNIDYTKTQDLGQDLRFTDSDGTVLAYEIEKWDETGSSYVWVKVPQIDQNSNTDYVYIYYGNTGASDGQTESSVWNSGYKMVQHFNESSGVHYDSTANNFDSNSVTVTEQGADIGQIDGADHFNGAGDNITITAISPASQVTVTTWFKRLGVAGSGYHTIYMQGTQIELDAIESTGQIRAGVTTATMGRQVFNSGSGLGDGQFHQLGLVYNGETLKAYIDGVQTSSQSVSGALSTGSATTIGKLAPSYYVNGVLDEIRVSDIGRSAAWIAASYKSETNAFNTIADEVSQYPDSGILISNILDAGFAADWGELSYTASGSGVTIKVRTDSSPDMSGATDWGSCSGIASGTDLTETDCVTDQDQYLQYQATLTVQGALSPELYDISVPFTASDQLRPSVNAANVAITGLTSGNWTSTEPTITWTAGTDDTAVAGYCISLDEQTVDATPSASLNPETDAGEMNGLDDGITNNSTCPYIVAGTSVDLSSISGLTLPTNKQYWFSIKAVDAAGNVANDIAGPWQDLVSFKYDSTVPTNVAYLTMPSTNFSNVVDMNFSWPTSGGSASSDSESGVLGWQYQLNSSAGSWQGTTYNAEFDLDYIPATASAYTFIAARDEANVITGNNVVYFRTVDNAGNPSSAATYRTGNLTYGGEAPSFPGDGVVTIDPTTSDTNEFSLSWSEATPTDGQNVTSYYYMINTSPPSSLATLQGNASTYWDNGTEITLVAAALPNVNKGVNTVYVVAIDDAETPNYSPSNYISGSFTLNSTDPDNVGNLVASDSSIKSSSQWNVTLTWTAPSYQGAGNLTYLIYRSVDGSSFSRVGSTSGLSYVDNTPASVLYYYKVYSQDGAEAISSGTNAVSITPTGKWTSAPGLSVNPAVSSITTKKATITWSTDRTSDSKIQYGTGSGSYGSVEPSNSSQVAAHSIQLTGLSPGTTYYYKAKWTDEDGNTGTSSEYSFTTDAAPVAQNVNVTSIGLDSAVINYTVTGASQVKIYYGTTNSFGGSTTLTTSTSETTYSTILSGLTDGTKYYYRINVFDEETAEYEGTILDFTTLPRPKIATVRLQQVRGSSSSTVLVTWTSNTEISSIVTYYPSANASAAQDKIEIKLVKAHTMLIEGLLPNTAYTLIVKGRDKIGNEALSNPQTFTTATDTRPPVLANLKVETVIQGAGEETTAQLVVAWDTDELSTSQVAYGEGSSGNLVNKTQHDTDLTYNHVVVVPNLQPSRVYHVKAISFDDADNESQSVDRVVITPKATQSALNFVIINLSKAFGFLGNYGSN